MKRVSPLLFILITCCTGAAAEPKLDIKAGGKSTNDLTILAEDGFEFIGDTAIYRGNVQVSDGQMNLSCELLTVTFQTNQTNSPKLGAQTNQAGATKLNPPYSQAPSMKLERIVAESHVVITQQQGRATGDLAIYTATNDLLVLIGRGVVQTPQGPYGNAVLETPQGSLMGTNVIFDRKRNRIWAPGKVLMQLPPDVFGKPGMSLLGTNALRLPGMSPPGGKRSATNSPPNK